MLGEAMSEKLKILTDAAKYDASCSSSGSSRKNTASGIGAAESCGICHSWSADGRCISLLKILMTNRCIYDCAYCVNRVGNDIRRALMTPREIADLTIEFYRRNYIEGLFLSSGIYKSPDYTTELLIETARLLREEYKFNGYIHMKGIPGTDEALVQRLAFYADRMSVNIELPSETGLKLLAPHKTKTGILKPMNSLAGGIVINRYERKKSRKAGIFLPAGQTTQMIVGATTDRDRHILRLAESLYKRIHLKRVYYSAYVPVVTDTRLPVVTEPPLKREHRLYQADWLLRFYGFKADEILSEDNPDFDLYLDPKACWALRHPEVFPVEINKASYEMLLRVPGIGVLSARRICAARRSAYLSFYTVKRLGIVMKRAKYFITCKGKYFGGSYNLQNIDRTLRLQERQASYAPTSLF